MVTLTPSEIHLIDSVSSIDSRETQKIIDEITKISNISWDHPLSNRDITDWLSNFDGSALDSKKAEQNLALWLLSGFVYFSLDDVRAYCRNIYREYIHHKLTLYADNHIFQDLSVQEQITHILDSTLFLALGNDSESGSNVLYFFRQENELKKEVFEKKMQGKFENIVFLDDVTISGIQALTYICQMQDSLHAEHFYFLTFIATNNAIDELKYINVDVICANEISTREQCFGKNSYVFSASNRNEYLGITRKMCEHYGQVITEGHSEVENSPLGVDQAQGMFCFYYNTPDNTLPIFWCNNNGWKPIFKRYEKIPNRNGVLSNGSRYV